MCMVTKCEGAQLGLGHLDNNEDENEWLSALGWQNFKTLNMSYWTCQVDLVCGFFAWGYVVKTHPKDVKTQLFWRRANGLMKCLIFLLCNFNGNKNVFHWCNYFFC